MGDVSGTDPRIGAMTKVQLGNPEGMYSAKALLAAADAIDPARQALAAIRKLRDSWADRDHHEPNHMLWSDLDDILNEAGVLGEAQQDAREMFMRILRSGLSGA